MPDPALARKETIVQEEVARLGYATPTVRAAGGPEAGLVVCLRALVEVAGWDEPERERRSGHPWLVSGPAFASRLSKLTGSPVRPR